MKYIIQVNDTSMWNTSDTILTEKYPFGSQVNNNDLVGIICRVYKNYVKIMPVKNYRNYRRYRRKFLRNLKQGE